MAYITGYPICTTPTEIHTIGIRRPQTFDAGNKVVVALDDRVWALVDDEFWFECKPKLYDTSRYYEFLDHYERFEREHLESLMVESGEVVHPLADGVL